MRVPPLTYVRTGQFLEGVGIRKEDLRKFFLAGGLQWNMLYPRNTTKAMHKGGDYNMTDVTPEYEKANRVISEAQAAYTATLAQFRGTIKNDLASISASADRVLRECAKMRTAYDATAKMLTSQDFERAIANAERLATALRAISELSSHSITFAVLDKKPAA